MTHIQTNLLTHIDIYSLYITYAGVYISGRPWRPLYASGDHPLREGRPAGDYGFSFIANVR